MSHMQTDGYGWLQIRLGLVTLGYGQAIRLALGDEHNPHGSRGGLKQCATSGIHRRRNMQNALRTEEEAQSEVPNVEHSHAW